METKHTCLHGCRLTSNIPVTIQTHHQNDFMKELQNLFFNSGLFGTREREEIERGKSHVIAQDPTDSKDQPEDPQP
jgi:hypothetical protein